MCANEPISDWFNRRATGASGTKSGLAMKDFWPLSGASKTAKCITTIEVRPEAEPLTRVRATWACQVRRKVSRALAPKPKRVLSGFAGFERVEPFTG